MFYLMDLSIELVRISKDRSFVFTFFRSLYLTHEYRVQSHDTTFISQNIALATTFSFHTCSSLLVPIMKMAQYSWYIENNFYF